MNHHYYNPQYSPLLLRRSTQQNLNEVFAILQQERQLTATSRHNHTMEGPTLPPNNLNNNNNNDNNNNNNNDSANNVMVNILAITWLFVFMWFCCRGRPPGPEHWRGAEIRRRYLERLARERAKKDKKLQSPEYRRRLVQHNMHTRTVIAKDEEGNWTLGPVHYRVPDIANMSTTTRSTAQHDDDEEDNENDYSCVICLDPFHVGDVVSWSRFSEDCHHVYHADCIQPWLEGRRQDECPSCRNRLLLQEPPGLKRNNTTITTTETDGTTTENNADSNGNSEGGDIETGNNTGASQDDEEEVDEAYLDKQDEEEEEDSFFVIMHGLISRVAKQASYTLIGTKDSLDSLDEKDFLPPASPFRRVVSYEPMRSSPHMIMNRSRPNSFSRSSPSPSPSSSFLQTIQAVQSFESEESHEDRDASQATLEVIPFRRVQSDIVGTTIVRRSQQQQQLHNTFAGLQSPCHSRPEDQTRLATTSYSDDKETISTPDTPSPPPPTTTTTENGNDEMHQDLTTERPGTSEDEAVAEAPLDTHEPASTSP